MSIDARRIGSGRTIAPGRDASGFVPMQGERVRLRPLRDGDLPRFLAYRSDPEVARYQGWASCTEDEARAFIRSMAAVDGPIPGQWIQLGIALAGPDELIGDVGLLLHADGLGAQVGYSCSAQHQRQGLTTEAVRLLLQALAGHTRCNVVHAVVDSRNLASERLLVRLGFRVVDAVAVTHAHEKSLELRFELHLHPQPFAETGRR